MKINVTSLRKYKIRVSSKQLNAYRDAVKNADIVINDMINRQEHNKDIESCIKTPPKTDGAGHCGAEPFIEAYKVVGRRIKDL